MNKTIEKRCNNHALVCSSYSYSFQAYLAPAFAYSLSCFVSSPASFSSECATNVSTIPEIMGPERTSRFVTSSISNCGKSFPCVYSPLLRLATFLFLATTFCSAPQRALESRGPARENSIRSTASPLLRCVRPFISFFFPGLYSLLFPPLLLSSLRTVPEHCAVIASLNLVSRRGTGSRRPGVLEAAAHPRFVASCGSAPIFLNSRFFIAVSTAAQQS